MLNSLVLKFNTACFMVVLFWTWPIRLFYPEYNNCYFYTLEKLITVGGKAKWFKSKWWWGYHVAWIHEGIEYHYDMRAGDRRNIRKVAPLGIPIFYKGYIKKRNVNNKKRVRRQSTTT